LTDHAKKGGTGAADTSTAAQQRDGIEDRAAPQEIQSFQGDVKVQPQIPDFQGDEEPQLREERDVWNKADQELARQVGLHCHERGVLLTRAHARHNEMLEV
jgi:hypothetical protein